MNDKNGCLLLGDIFKKEKNLENVKKYYTKACDLKEGSACFQMGYVYRTGLDGRTDLQKGNEYLKRACGLDNSAGCTMYGFSILQNSSKSQDISESYFCRLFDAK